MSEACTKLKSAFSVMSYVPDGRVFAGVPFAKDSKYMSPEQTTFYMDALWLDAQANPALELGDYIPDKMPTRYKIVHAKLGLSRLWPIGVKKDRVSKQYDPETGKVRTVEKASCLRFQNGRQGPAIYKRMVLDEKFKKHVGPKSARFVNWVASDSDALEDNARNALMNNLVDAYAGKIPRLVPNLKAKEARRAPHSNGERGGELA